MESLVALVVGAFFAAAVYLMLSPRLVRILLGITILANAVNLLIFTTGRLTSAAPPVFGDHGAGQGPVANPIPQALILTAIVISFAIFVFLLVLSFRTCAQEKTDTVDDLSLAEPDKPPQRPSVDY